MGFSVSHTAQGQVGRLSDCVDEAAAAPGIGGGAVATAPSHAGAGSAM